MDPSQVPAALRLKVEAHVLARLKGKSHQPLTSKSSSNFHSVAVYPHVIPDVVSAEASAIETTAFAKAKTKGEYICMVSSYSDIHQERETTGNDAYRIPKLSAPEEALRIAKFRKYITNTGNMEKIKRATQNVTSEHLQGSQGNAPQNAPNTAQPSIQSNVQANIQENLQMPQNLQQQLTQPVTQQQIPQQVAQQQIVPTVSQQQIPQPVVSQQIPRRVSRQPIPQPGSQLQANVVNPQTVSQPMVPHTAQNPGMVFYTYFPTASAIPSQSPNAHQMYPLDPALYAHAQVNPNVMPTQAFTSQAVPTSQTIQSLPSGSASQQVTQPVVGPAQNPLVRPHPNGAPVLTHFSDDMITQLAHQTAQASAAQSASTVRRQGSSHPPQRERRIAPNRPHQAQTIQNPQILMDQKAQLVAKWINLQRAYRQKIEKIQSAVGGIILPVAEQKKILEELEEVQPVLRVPVERLFADDYSETNYMKAAAHLTNIVDKYKNYEKLDSAEIRAQAAHHARSQHPRQGRQSSSNVRNAPDQLNRMKQTPVQGRPIQTTNPRRASQRPISSQVSTRPARRNGKLTARDAQKQISDPAQVELHEQQMRAARSRAAQEVARRHRMRTAAMRRTTSLPASSTQQRQEKARMTNSIHHGVTGQASNFTLGTASGSITAAEATKQTALALKAGNAAMAAASVRYNPRKRPAAQMAMASQLNNGTVQKKASTSQGLGSIGIPIPNIHPSVHRQAGSSQGTEIPRPITAKQTIQPQTSNNIATNPAVSQRIQAVVQEHVRSNVTQHVHKHIKDAISVPSNISARNAKGPLPGTQPLSEVRKQQKTIEHPKAIQQTGMDEQPGPIEQPRTVDQANPVQSSPQLEPFEQLDSIQQGLLNDDPLWNNLPEDSIVGLPDLSHESEIQSSNPPMSGKNSGQRTEINDVAEQDIDLSVLDNLEKISLSPEDLARSIECSRLNLIRVLAADPATRQALSDAMEVKIDDDDAAIERIQALLDGEIVPNRSMRVEETIKALEGKAEQPKTPLKPKTPSKPRTQSKPKAPMKPKKIKKLTLIEQATEDYEAFEKKCDFMKCEVHQEYKKPVLLCKAMVEEILIPNLVLRVFKGYPTVGTVTYSFQEPALGWCGPLKKIRTIFMESVASCGSECGVGDVLEAWKSAIIEVTQKRREERKT